MTSLFVILGTIDSGELYQSAEWWTGVVVPIFEKGDWRVCSN